MFSYNTDNRRKKKVKARFYVILCLQNSIRWILQDGHLSSSKTDVAFLY